MHIIGSHKGHLAQRQDKAEKQPHRFVFCNKDNLENNGISLKQDVLHICPQEQLSVPKVLSLASHPIPPSTSKCQCMPARNFLALELKLSGSHFNVTELLNFLLYTH